MTEPTILQGYSYPLIRLADVIAYEARQGRTIRLAIQHAGGWAVSEDNPARGRTEAIMVNWDSERVDWMGQNDSLDNEPEPCYNEGVGVAPDPGAAKAT